MRLRLEAVYPLRSSGKADSVSTNISSDIYDNTLGHRGKKCYLFQARPDAVWKCHVVLIYKQLPYWRNAMYMIVGVYIDDLISHSKSSQFFSRCCHVFARHHLR